MVSFDGYIRDVTVGEPIADIWVHEGDAFDIRFKFYDDEGNPWNDGWTATTNFFMSRSDTYSGTSDEKFAFIFSGTTSGGSGTVTISLSGTATPGDYTGEIVLSSGSVEFTIGEFKYIVERD